MCDNISAYVKVNCPFFLGGVAMGGFRGVPWKPPPHPLFFL